MIWTIHTAHNEQGDDIHVVRESAGAWAFWVPSLWLARHRLWFACAASLCVTFLWAGLLSTPYAAGAWVLGLVHSLYVWLEGSQLRRAKLARKGWIAAGVVEAPDEETALARALLRDLAARPAEVRPAPPELKPRLPARQARSGPSTFGMFGA